MSTALRERRASAWRVEGQVLSSGVGTRMTWRWPWARLGFVLAGGLAAYDTAPLATPVLWTAANALATWAGYALVALILLGTLGRSGRSVRRWAARGTVRCLLGLLRLPVLLWRAVPRPRRERTPTQTVVVQRADGTRRLTVVPVARAGFHATEGDAVRVWGWPWRGALIVVAARNVTTGQAWGWTL